MSKLGEQPTEPCPDPSKPYLWIDGKWVLIATDRADGVDVTKRLPPKKVVNTTLNSEPKKSSE